MIDTWEVGHYVDAKLFWFGSDVLKTEAELSSLKSQSLQLT
jgi:hypothetical protein